MQTNDCVFHFGLPNTGVTTLSSFFPGSVPVKCEKKINTLNKMDSERMDKPDTMEYIEYVRRDMVDYLGQIDKTNLATIVWDPSDQVGEDGKTKNLIGYLGAVKAFVYRCGRQPVSDCGKYFKVKQKYAYAKGQSSGRIYVKGFGIQSLQTSLRGAMCHELNQDFDMKNAHPTILLYIKNTYDIFGMQDIPTPMLEEYVKNRESVLKNSGFTKKRFLTVMNSDNAKIKNSEITLKCLNLECNQIKALLYKEYNNQITTTNEKNPISSICNKLLCIEENKMLQMAIRLATDQHHEVHTPMFDGCTIRLNYKVTTQEFIDNLDNLTKYAGVKWSEKPHDISIKMDPDFIDDPFDSELLQQEFEENHCMIMDPLTFIREYIDKDNVPQFSMYTHNQFSSVVANYVIASDEAYLSYWMKNKNRRQYTTLDFLPPPMVCHKSVYNTFKGFRHDALLAKGVTYDDDTDIGVFTRHLGLIVGTEKNPECTLYLTQYLADMIQFPGRLPQIAIIIKSIQGMGKNIYFENFCDKIFGKTYRISTSKKEQLVGRFTTIGSKMMIISDEAGSDRTTFLGNGQIKELITQPTIEVEKKGVDTYPVSNFGRYLFFSNLDCPMEIESSDRRFVGFECDSQKPGPEYYNELAEAFNDDSRVLKFVNYLQNIDLTNVDLRRDRVQTSFYKELQSYSRPMSARFMEDIVNTESETGSVQFISSELYALYTQFIKNTGSKYTETYTKFGRDIGKYDGISKKYAKRGGKSVPIYTIDIKLAQKYMVINNLVDDIFDTTDTSEYIIIPDISPLDIV